MTSGIVAAWIGKGDTAPIFVSALAMLSPMPRSENETPSTSSARIEVASSRSSTTSSLGWKGFDSFDG